MRDHTKTIQPGNDDAANNQPVARRPDFHRVLGSLAHRSHPAQPGLYPVHPGSTRSRLRRPAPAYRQSAPTHLRDVMHLHFLRFFIKSTVHSAPDNPPSDFVVRADKYKK